MPSAQIRIPRIDRYDERALRELIPSDFLTVESGTTDTEFGELANTAVITLALPAIYGFVAFLIKDRTTDEEERVLEVTDTTGVTHRETIRRLKSTSKSKEGVLRSLANLCKFDFSAPDK